MSSPEDEVSQSDTAVIPQTTSTDEQVIDMPEDSHVKADIADATQGKSYLLT